MGTFSKRDEICDQGHPLGTVERVDPSILAYRAYTYIVNTSIVTSFIFLHLVCDNDVVSGGKLLRQHLLLQIRRHNGMDDPCRGDRVSRKLVLVKVQHRDFQCLRDRQQR